MLTVNLIRLPTKYAMHGILVVLKDGETHVFHTLERPWLNNKRNMSCIPSDTYSAAYLPRSASGKYRKVWHVRGVIGRSGILIHNGNLVAHTKGCILLGMKRGMLTGKPAVLSSRTAMRKFRKLVGENDFDITIWGNQELQNAA